MLRVTSRGNFKNTTSFIDRCLHHDIYSDLDKFGKMGVDLLSKATPKETGKTAASWSYRIVVNGRHTGIEWHNDNTADGTPIAVLIQYGHATGTGGFVQGRDYINPVMRPLFDEIANDVWEKVNQ